MTNPPTCSFISALWKVGFASPLVALAGVAEIRVFWSPIERALGFSIFFLLEVWPVFQILGDHARQVCRCWCLCPLYSVALCWSRETYHVQWRARRLADPASRGRAPLPRLRRRLYALFGIRPLVRWKRECHTILCSRFAPASLARFSCQVVFASELTGL